MSCPSKVYLPEARQPKVHENFTSPSARPTPFSETYREEAIGDLSAGVGGLPCQPKKFGGHFGSLGHDHHD